LDRLVEDSLQIARDAMSRGAWAEAFELLVDADKTGRLGPSELETLAEAAWWSGHPELRANSLERAHAAYVEAGDRRKAAKVAIELFNEAFLRLSHSVAVGWMKRAERLLEGEPEGPEHGYLELAYAYDAFFRRNDLDEALPHLERVLEIGRRFKNSELEAMGLNLQGRVLLRRGDLTRGLALIDESTVAVVAGELGPQTAGNVYCSTISACRDMADWGRAVEATQQADRYMERRKITGYPGVCRVHRAEIKAVRGSWLEAEQEAKAACKELEDFRLLYAVGRAHYEMGEIRLRMGDLQAADEAFQRAYEFGRDPQPGLALLLLAQGDSEAAALSIKRALSEIEQPEHLLGNAAKDPLGRAWLLPAEAEIGLSMGDLDTARSAVEELEIIAATFGSTALEGAAASARGALFLSEGDAAAAVTKLSLGWRLWQQVDAPYQSARARKLLGEAYWANGDGKTALQELRAARSVFERLGALLDLRVVDGLLETYGGVASSVGRRAVKTFMFTDIVTSTDLIGVIGDEAWEEILRWHDETLRSLFIRHGGQEVKHTGDGFFVAFDEPRTAIECAVEIQHTLLTHRRQHGFAPWIRIGVHSDQATYKDRDYQGKGVHAAARIAALAGRDEILASQATLDAAAPQRFPVGESQVVSLKGIKEPVEVVGIRWH
jgi:class 3 adenylate cyclase